MRRQDKWARKFDRSRRWYVIVDRGGREKVFGFFNPTGANYFYQKCLRNGEKVRTNFEPWR